MAEQRRPRAAAAAAGALVLAVLLTGCARPPPPPPPAPPTPSASAPAVRPMLHATWSFAIRPGDCLATAAAGRTRVVLSVPRGKPIRMRIVLAGASAQHPVAHFRGPAGAWTIGGWRAGDHAVAFELGHDVNALSRVLILLSGGVLDLEAAEAPLPRLELPASGAAGQRWFGCVRHSVI